MMPIDNMEVYNAGMRKSMLDKIWWIDKIDDSVDSVMDYGCADGALLSMIHDMNNDLALFGYDFNSDMIDLASDNVETGCFATDFDVLNKLISEKNKCVLIASSVFHEIENYSENIEEEYNRIFSEKHVYTTVGHGIKMQLCKKIIDFHSGKIKVSNFENNNNLLTFTIPKSKKQNILKRPSYLSLRELCQEK